MNIFVLDYDPVRAARMQCDKHVVKMPLETAQLLCGVFPEGRAPYKRTHYNHPCSKWVRQSKGNFLWTVEHGLALCSEYFYRYGKIHKCEDIIHWCSNNISKLEFELERKTNFVCCFEEKYLIGNAVESYRNYYKKEKIKIAKWEKNRKVPRWF